MKYYIIAGEASGDLHGGNLIKALKAQDSKAQFRFWGGDYMQKQAECAPQKHIESLAFMGFTQVVLNLNTIRKNLQYCKQDILEYQPDVLILIDYPGFNLRIAAFAKKHGIKVAYYISPQVWAWKEGRVKQMRRNIDLMLCILPFEKAFFAKHGMEVTYVGHPLLDAVEQYREMWEQPKAVDAPVALIPGSRKQEISTMLPTMLKVAQAFPNEQFRVTAAPAIPQGFYQQFPLPKNVQLVEGQTHKTMFAAKAALVTSGTATLETALFNTPEVVCYKAGYLSYWLAKQLIKVPYISLVNLVMDREVVRELIQADFNTQETTKSLKALLNPDKRSSLLQDYKLLRQKLGGPGASDRAAKAIVQLVT